MYIYLKIIIPFFILVLLWLFLEIFILCPLSQDFFHKRLYNKLRKFADKNNIPISVGNVEEMEDAAGKFYYYESPLGGILDSQTKYIKVLKQYERDPFLLAHELGHYISLKKINDNNEYWADYYGKELVLKNINLIEKIILAIPIHCSFSELKKTNSIKC